MTWKAFIEEVDAKFYINSLQSEAVEDNIFFQMTNLLSDIGSLGGNFEDLTEKLNNLKDNVTEFKREFGDEKDFTFQRFTEFRDKNIEL